MQSGRRVPDLATIADAFDEGGSRSTACPVGTSDGAPDGIRRRHEQRDQEGNPASRLVDVLRHPARELPAGRACCSRAATRRSRCPTRCSRRRSPRATSRRSTAAAPASRAASRAGHLAAGRAPRAPSAATAAARSEPRTGDDLHDRRCRRSSIPASRRFLIEHGVEISAEPIQTGSALVDAAVRLRPGDPDHRASTSGCTGARAQGGGMGGGADGHRQEQGAPLRPGRRRRGSPSPTSPASTRPRTSWSRSSTSCKRPEKYTRLGGTAPKGVLLVGAPGTGKTLLAQGRRRRGRRAVLLDERRRVRGDDRRRRRGARARPVQAGARARAGDHLHRRARRDRPRARRRSRSAARASRSRR